MLSLLNVRRNNNKLKRDYEVDKLSVPVLIKKQVTLSMKMRHLLDAT